MLDLSCEIQTTPENTLQSKNIIESSKGLLQWSTLPLDHRLSHKRKRREDFAVCNYIPPNIWQSKIDIDG